MALSTCTGRAGENTARELALDTIGEIFAQLGDDVQVYEVECLDCGAAWEEPWETPLRPVVEIHIRPRTAPEQLTRRLAS